MFHALNHYFLTNLALVAVTLFAVYWLRDGTPLLALTLLRGPDFMPSEDAEAVGSSRQVGFIEESEENNRKF